MKKELSSQTKSLVPNNLLTRHLTDYLLTEVFLFEIKQKKLVILLNAENTVALTPLELPNEDLHPK